MPAYAYDPFEHARAALFQVMHHGSRRLCPGELDRLKLEFSARPCPAIDGSIVKWRMGSPVIQGPSRWRWMMGGAPSGDLRSRVLKASADGMSARQAAARFGVGVSSAIRWIARSKIGELAPRPQGRRRASSLDAPEPSSSG